MRAVTAWELGRHAGRTQREIAVMFGVATGKAVGVQQEKVKRGIQENRKLAKLVSAIDSEIEKRKLEQ